jgi:predicted enzyme related to lactoylglutathione lyase
MPNPIVHFEIGCRDREKSTTFYQQLFDWEMTPGEISTDIRTDVESAIAQAISGHIVSLGHEPFNYTNFYVGVSSVSEYLAKAEALGGKTLIPAHQAAQRQYVRLVLGHRREYHWPAVTRNVVLQNMAVQDGTEEKESRLLPLKYSHGDSLAQLGLLSRDRAGRAASAARSLPLAAFAWQQMLRWQAELVAIPAPPFGEERRAVWMAEQFRLAGLAEVHTDSIGNVFGVLPGGEPGSEDDSAPVVLLSAHLDTVFPAKHSA